MKQWIIGIMGIIGGLALAAGVYIKMKDHATASISIIGGADGPTSIFLAGKLGNSFGSLGVLVGICLIGIAVIIYVKRKK